MDLHHPLMPEDYVEPACPMCAPQDAGELRPVPMGRIVEKLEEHLSRRDYEAAGRHLTYWLREAEAGRDVRGQFSLHNELMGHYRKVGDEENALAHAAAALALLEEIGPDTVSAGTALVNAATVQSAFGRWQAAYDLFARAQANYEENLPPEDARLGGLYNNMALALTALGRCEEAHRCFQRALEIMARQPQGQPEQAITYLNMADAVAAEHGMEKGEKKIEQYLTRAQALLEAPGVPHNGYFAFVCEKCAPVFDYYGWFAFAAALREQARRIYEGS